MMIVSEFVGSFNGIGGEVIVAQGSGQISVMWAVIVILGILGVILNLLLVVAERLVLSWQQPVYGGA
jgi:ABC-type nitrate/sulfonate/bicarbonate transport system permease component